MPEVPDALCGIVDFLLTVGEQELLWSIVDLQLEIRRCQSSARTKLQDQSSNWLEGGRSHHDFQESIMLGLRFTSSRIRICRSIVAGYSVNPLPAQLLRC
jgi:hypothetical protein